MSLINCEGCGTEISQSSSVRVNEKRFCSPCGEQATVAANHNNVCAQCGVDFGSMLLPRVGGAPFCEPCRAPLYERDFPGWLKAAFVGLCVALAFAVYHAAPYFRAGRDYYRAEKLYEQHRYAESIAGFESAMKTGPDAKKIRLQLALAYLKSGDPNTAFTHVKGISFEQSPEFTEMQSMFNRFDKAAAKIEEANKLAAEDHSGEAAKRLREAKVLYPELAGLDDGIASLDLGDAYERKDYYRFVKLSEEQWQRQPNSEHAAALASALACRYAISGDAAVRTRAEELLHKAESLIKTDEERKSFDEYRPRIEYRLKSREIIDRKEFNRRFRPDQDKEKAS